MVLKDIGIIVALLMIIVALFMIFEARKFVKRYVKAKDENVSVNSCKIFGVVIMFICLYFIYLCR